MSLSEGQKTALRVVPRVTAALSFMGSAFILIAQRRSRRRVVGQSLLLSMCVLDLLSSTSYLIGDAAFPTSRHGSVATCNIQGMLCHLQVGAAIHSGFLAWYYCLFVRFNWKEERLAKFYLPAAHCIVWLFLIITGALAFQYFDPHWIRCYITGPGSNLYFWIFFYVPIWSAMFLGSIAMALIYQTVRKTEEASARHHFPGVEVGSASMDNQSSFRISVEALPRTHRVAYQSLGYTMAFIANYVFPTTSRIFMTMDKAPPYPIRLLAVSFVTSQGFWNWLVYYVLPFWYESRYKGSTTRSDNNAMVSPNSTDEESRRKSPAVDSDT